MDVFKDWLISLGLGEAAAAFGVSNQELCGTKQNDLGRYPARAKSL
jgi:hypothetical protein